MWTLWLLVALLAYGVPMWAQEGDSKKECPSYYLFQPIADHRYVLQREEIGKLLRATDTTVCVPLRWNGSELTLQLRSFALLSPTAVILQASDTAFAMLTPPRHRAFLGDIAEIPGSFVHLLVFEDEIFGFLSLAQPVRQLFSFQQASDRTYRLVVDTALERELFCQAESVAPEQIPQFRKRRQQQQQWSPTMYRADLAIECDKRYYDFLGQSVGRAVRYAFALVAAVSAIYQRDVRCQLRINFLRVWTTTGPYTGSNTATLLTQLRSYWNSNMTHVRRTLTHLLVRADIGGRAYIDKLCSSNYGYGVSGIHATYNYPSSMYTWDAYVMSHELGHNFGAWHTHECFWNPPIDSCAVPPGGCFSTTVARAGTIMSYCSSRSLYFHPVVAAYIRQKVEQAACLTATSKSQDHDLRLVAMLKPVPGGEYSTTATITPQVVVQNGGNTTETSLTVSVSIATTSGTVVYSSTAILASLAGLSTATLSFANFSTTATGIYQVSATVTNASADPVMSNNELTLAFAVSSAPLNGTITLVAPTSSTTYTAGDSVVISFSVSSDMFVTVEWSPDDGKTWQLIEDRYYVRVSYGTVHLDWTVPAYSTQQARIRVSALDNPTVSTTSVLFGITVPVDLEVTELVFPSPWSKISGCFAPEFTVRNAGDSTISSIPYRYTIVDRITWDTVYRHQDTLPVSLLPRTSYTLTLPPVHLSDTHQYMCFAHTLHPDDANVENDSLTGAFEVVNATTSEFIVGEPRNVNYVQGFPAPYGFYNVNGSKHQMLIRRHEIPVPGTVFLTSIAFNVGTVRSSPNSNWSIGLAHTSDTAVSTAFAAPSNFTTVTSLSVTTPHTGWNEYSFSQPFALSPDSNLIVQTCFENTFTGTENTQTYMSNVRFNATVVAGGTTNICQLSSGFISNYRPMMRFRYVLPPTVVYPNGYETLTAGTQQVIQWSTNCTSTPVRIEFSSNGGQSWSTIASATSNTGSLLWTVPAVATTTALIRIAFADMPMVEDRSNAPFTIVSPATAASITVHQPNGGEQWQVGLSYSVTWQSVSVTTVTVAYSTTGGSSWTIIATTAATTGSVLWTVPDEPTTMALIRVSDAGDPAVSDQSDGFFTIVPIFPPSSVVATAGNAVVTLSWLASTSSGVTGYAIDRRLTTGTFSQIATTTQTVFADHSVTNGTTYEYAVRTLVGSFSSDRSSPVQATPVAPTLTLLTPTAGTVLWSGAVTSITWTWSGSIPSVTLQWRRWSHQAWQPLAAAVPNTGSYGWTVPDAPTTGASIRIFATTDPTIADELPASLSIYSSTQTAVNLRVMLQGATTSGTMQTLLGASLPLTQPFTAAPYFYTGTEQRSTAATNVVDWILIRFRSATDASLIVATTAALLRSDGTVLDESGFPQALVPSTLVPAGSYYLSVHHRNHIPLISNVPVSLQIGSSAPFAMTTTANLFSDFAAPAAILPSGKAAAYGGDVALDGIINARDRVQARNALFSTGYVTEDATLDGVVNASDRSLIRNNTFVVTQVP